MPDHDNGFNPESTWTATELWSKIEALELQNSELVIENETIWDDRYDLGFDDGWKAGRDEALENAY